MSRVRQELSVVQFQVQNRQANASMDALREKAKSLSDAMADVNQKIADLGNVPYDDQTLAGYRQDLKKLKSDLKDVTTAQNELMKGVKAADKLWKAAETGTMEQLSVKEIKAGQRGMKARMLNLNPGSQDDMEMQRLMKIAIAEGEVEVKKFNADVKFLLQTIRDGGNVSIDVLKNAKSELTDLCDITDRGTKEWKDYNAQLTEISEKIKMIAVEDMRSSGQKMLGRAFRGDFATADTKTLNEVIAKLREYQSVIDDPHGKGARIIAATEMQIQNLSESLSRIKEEGALKLMTERLGNLSTLSKEALAETRKFWQAMYDGAEKNDPELKKIETRLKDIAEEEGKRSKENLRSTARSILTNQESMSEEELRRGIAAAKEYMQQFSIGGKVREKYNEAILRGNELLKQYSTEAVQAKQKEAELDAKMTERMTRLPNLSAAALEETKKYWQAQLAGAERGSEAYREIEARIKAVSEEQKKMSIDQLKQTAKGVFGIYSNMSEGELGNAIKAAKEYVLTLNNEGEARKKMNAAILEAEKYQKEHSLETERARQKEQELNDVMTERLTKLPRLTSAALEETKKYWQAQLDGAEKGSQEALEFEQRIKAINDQQKQNANERLRKQARSILTNQESMSEEELRRGIAAAKEYMQQFSLIGKVREKYNEAILRGEELLKRTGIEAMREAQREADAKAETIRKEQELNQAMTDRMANLHRLTDGALSETKKYWEAQLTGVERGSKEAAEFEAHIKAINDLQGQRQLTDTKNAARSIFRDQSMMTEEELRSAIAAAKEYVQTFRVGGQVREMYNQAIARGEDLLKEYSVEQERAKQKEIELKQTMTARMTSLTTLSADALTETKKYWQAQYDGAERSSQAFKDAEDAMKRINEQETIRKAGQATRVLSNMQDFGDAEIRQAVQAMEQLRDAQAHGSAQWELYNKRIEEGRRYLDEWKQTDSVVKFEGQMAKLPQLSDAALQETKKFWETMVAGAEKGSSELREYEAHLEKVKQEERERQQISDEIAVERLNDNLMNFSTGEIEEAIKAGERLASTYKTGEEAAVNLAKKIAAAKEYVKTFGDETTRSAHEQMVEVSGARTLERAQNGEFSTASMDELDKTIKKLKEYQALIKDPNGTGKEAFETTKEQVDALTEQLNRLKGVAEKVKDSFKDADEVLARFGEHMNAGKTASEGMASSIDEKLSQATSGYDTLIEDAIKDVENYEQQIKEATQELADMEKELAELEAKHKNSSWFRKQTKAYRREAWRIEDLRDEIEGYEVRRDDGSSFRTGKKQFIEDLQGWKLSAQSWVDFYKKQKAEELGITEEVEEKKQDAQRLTQEQMQEGIKLLEEEYRKTDHTTAEGIKRREQLRQTIDQMNQEIKESTGEWMSLAQAEELASKAGTSGFFATGQQMQQATQAIERQRDALLKTIQQKQRDGEATKKEEEELQRLEKVLKDLKFEQDNFNMSHKQMEDLLKHPKKADDLDQLKAAIKRADGELRRMEGSLGKNSKEYKAFAEQVKVAKNTLKDMEGAAKASASAWEKAVSRLKTYVGLYMGFNILWQKMMGTIGDLHELSDRMGEVGKTTQMASGEIDLLTDNLKKIDTRTPVTELLSLSAAAGQLGLKSREDVEGFTEAANKMLVALPEMGRDGATQMMKVALATGEVERIRKQMEEGMIEGSSATAVAMEKIASTIDQLRANSAAAAPQITDFVKRVGAVGAQSGITIDQVAALGSTVDALGMRVEMSATALSRMIPAIKNNAFEVAKAIGMAPEALRHMFDEAGGGMNAMLAIFQHIKDSGMNANDIEKMMGMGGMQDIMKDLNQQGARAGIVFAGLSQNVDVLREHLGIAHDAYEENIAIQQEYDRMNETTAAKWERLANKVEEMFVGSGTQSALGKIYDMLTWIVDLITGPLNTAFLSATGAVLAIKSGLTEIPSAVGNVFDYLKDSAAKASEALEKAANATSEISEASEGVEEAGDAVGEISDALGDAKEAGEQAGEAMESATGAIEGMTGATKVSIFSVKGLKAAWKGLDTTMKANIIVAVIALLYTLGKALYNVMTSTNAQRDAVAKANQEADRAVEKLGVYFNRLDETKNALDEATKATEKMTDKTEKATEAEIKMTKAKEDHRAAIVNINQNYSKYLGFMLTEYDRAELLAAAHNKIAAAIRREILMKQKQAAIDENSSEASEGLTKDWSKFSEEMVEDNRMTSQQAADARIALKKFLPKSFTVGSDGKTLVASDELKKSLGSLYNENASLNELTAVWFARHLQQNYGMTRDAIKDITGIDYYKSDYGTSKGKYVWTTSKGGTNLRGDYLDEYFELQQKNAESGSFFNDDIKAETKTIEEESSTLVSELKTNIQSQITLLKMGGLNAKETEEAYQELARGLEGINENVVGLTAAEQKETENTIKTLLDQNKTVIDSKRLKKAREKIQQGFDAFDTLGDDSDKNIWGSKQPAESTDWKNMTAEQLVNRRKQMADFVNAIQTDTDVKAVLEEDKALMKAFKGRQATMREVVEWYNQQRLLIQDELHARHLTNTGDWLDPKKERGAKKQFRDEMDAYLHELDAYYTERKTRIEQARNDEEITEGEAWRRTIQNDNEWQTRRAELQKLYSRKQQEVTKEELDAILHIISERTGDSEAFVKAAIAKTNQFVDAIEKSGDKGAAIVHRWMSQVVLDTERSYLKAAQAIGKQMKFIEETLAKERPYDGITKNLQDNLDKMGVLAAKYRRENEELARQGKEPKYSNEQITAQSYDEMAFYLRQAADAYSIDIDELLRRMVKEGMTATSKEISKSDMLKQAVMGQLRKTYQEVQDAVKKEASQIKKDVEIIWNDDARGIGGMSMKATFDKALAQLGMQQDSVSRANSLIGAGAASDNVASRLAMKQIEVQMRMQKAQYDMYRVQANQRMAALKAEAKEHQRIAELEKQAGHEAAAAEQRTKAMVALRDAENVRLSLGLTLAEETKKEEQQKAELLKIQEESQNRLYQSLREWADLLTSSIQGVFEASHAGDAEYYNERAKLDLTGKGGPGAGTYIVIDDAGTSDAKAHYEYLDERQALERQHEIEQQNAQAEAWKKLWDDINMKMSDQITDWINAMFQNASLDANTDATLQNTEALMGLSGAIAGAKAGNALDNIDLGGTTDGSASGAGATAGIESGLTPDQAQEFIEGMGDNPMLFWQEQSDIATQKMLDNMAALKKGQDDANKKMQASTQATFAKMTAAANMYGIAYQTMSNDNLSTTQKFEMMAVQAAGQSAISMLTVDFSTMTGEAAVNSASVLGKLWSQLGWYAIPVYALFTGLLGGLMGLAVSKIAKSKSEISQATGASVGAGRLATGMLTYKEGNVDAFTDPASLTPGKSYNVDAADGKTYRAKYTGTNPRTHLTNGPEFHLAGEAGREMIIDAGTTRQITMNENEIWRAIQTLSSGGRVSGFSTRRGRGVRAFAEGNLNDFEDISGSGMEGAEGFDDLTAMQDSLDRNTAVQEALLERLSQPIVAQNVWTGPEGIPNMVNKYQKEAKRHGVKYL